MLHPIVVGGLSFPPLVTTVVCSLLLWFSLKKIITFYALHKYVAFPMALDTSLFFLIYFFFSVM